MPYTQNKVIHLNVGFDEPDNLPEACGECDEDLGSFGEARLLFDGTEALVDHIRECVEALRESPGKDPIEIVIQGVEVHAYRLLDGSWFKRPGLSIREDESNESPHIKIDE